MAFSFLYLAVRALLGALVRSRRGLDVKDVELPSLIGTELFACVWLFGRPKELAILGGYEDGVWGP